MKRKVLPAVLFLAIGGFSSVSAQTETARPVEGGVLNGKAISLPKPAYPATAVAVNAAGSVTVKVTVDESGDVVSAQAVSGHPLLRAASVAAAKEAKFTPQLLSGQPVKFSGMIVYNFTQDENNARDGAKVKYKNLIISKGVLNGRAVSLPKPEYPEAARAVKAGGSVNVQVIIDMSGNITAAEAVSGHPLLRAAAVDAAKQARFAPTLADGAGSINVSGILVYNFGPPSSQLSWRSAGYEMAAAEQSAQLPIEFPAVSLDVLAPNDWNDERREILKLRTLQQALKISGEAKGQVTTARESYDIASVDHKQILNSLINSFEARLSGKQNDLWNFKLGTVLGKMSAQSDDDGALTPGIREIQQLRSSAPSGLDQSLDGFDEFAGKSSFSPEEKAKLKALIEKLRAN